MDHILSASVGSGLHAILFAAAATPDTAMGEVELELVDGGGAQDDGRPHHIVKVWLQRLEHLLAHQLVVERPRPDHIARINADQAQVR